MPHARLKMGLAAINSNVKEVSESGARARAGNTVQSWTAHQKIGVMSGIALIDSDDLINA